MLLVHLLILLILCVLGVNKLFSETSVFEVLLHISNITTNLYTFTALQHHKDKQTRSNMYIKVSQLIINSFIIWYVWLFLNYICRLILYSLCKKCYKSKIVQYKWRSKCITCRSRNAVKLWSMCHLLVESLIL